MKPVEIWPERAPRPSASNSVAPSPEGMRMKKISPPKMFSFKSLVPIFVLASLALLVMANAWMWMSSASTGAATKVVGVQAEKIADDTKSLRSMVESLQKALSEGKHSSLGIESYDCVNNPSRHYERTGTWRPECTTMIEASFHKYPEHSWPSAAYMLSLDTEESMVAFMQRKNILKNHNFDLQRFPAVNGLAKFGHLYEIHQDPDTNATVKVYKNPRMHRRVPEGNQGYLTAGEEGYRASMHKLFEILLEDENITSVLVADDDAMFSCMFGNDLRKLLKEPRCGAHVSQEAEQGGVLLLGSSVWLNGSYPKRGPWMSGWNVIDEDLRRTSIDHARVVHHGPTCYNVPSKVMGSFAVIYHRDVFRPIINWLDTVSRPFDHVFEELADKGFIVRAAYPSIAVQDLLHESSVDPHRKGQQDMTLRSQAHRWQLDKICNPRTEKAVQSKWKRIKDAKAAHANKSK